MTPVVLPYLTCTRWFPWQRSTLCVGRQRQHATNSEYDDYNGVLFIMRHRADPMSASNLTNTSNSEDVWFVDSGTSNHMMSHEEWFFELRTPNRPIYVETRDDTTHMIWHVGNFPFVKGDKLQQNLHQELLVCFDHNEEFGIDQPNHGARHASLIQLRWLLHWEWRATHQVEGKAECLSSSRTR